MNLAASHDPRITNAKAWAEGWKLFPNSSVARNIILELAVVVEIVRTAYESDQKLGTYFDVLAQTGTRESQMLRLRVRDLQDNNMQDGQAAPRLTMPTSFKGRNRKPGPRSTGGHHVAPNGAHRLIAHHRDIRGKNMPGSQLKHADRAIQAIRDQGELPPETAEALTELVDAVRYIEDRLSALERKGRPHPTEAMALPNQKLTA
jgi:hypothetical protein